MNLCPNCGGELSRDEVDIGVGVMYGPATCYSCGWYDGVEADMIREYEQDGQTARDEWFLALQETGGEG